MIDRSLPKSTAECGLHRPWNATAPAALDARPPGGGITAPHRGVPLVTPTRSPVGHTGRHFRGKFYSAKNARHIKCESYLEVLIARLLEFLRNVSGYSEQPPALSMRVGRRRRKYTPDFIVHRLSGSDYLVEVKPAELANLPELKVKFAAAVRAAEAQGYRFAVITDRDVGKIASRNVEEMLAIRGRVRTRALGTQEKAQEPALTTMLATAFAHGGSMPMSALLRLLGNGPGAHTELMTLLAFRVLAWNIDQQLELTTRIFLPKERDDEEVFA